MRWDEFVAIPNGTRVLNHSYDQCVALANLFHEQVIGGAFVPVGSAYQWSTQFNQYAQLTGNYIHLAGSDNPRPGDIFVSRGGIYNAVDGHIGVVVRGWDGSTFGTKEQNAERNRYVYQTYNRSKANMLGYLRPKNDPTGGSVVVEDDETMLTMWRNTDTGMVIAASMHTGYFWHLPNSQYAVLMREKGMVRNQDWINLAPNEWNFLVTLLEQARANCGSGAVTAQVDVAAIAKAVNDVAARRLAQ